MRSRGIFFLATILAAAAPAFVRAADAPADGRLDARQFPRPAELEPQIRFWRAVFSEYSAHQVVLHDALHLDKVYKVLDFRGYAGDDLSAATVERIRREETDQELERLRAILLRLHALGPRPSGLTPEEQRVFDLFADDPAPDRFLAAADSKRLRSQRGLRERFGYAVRVSRRYLPEMERIFQAEGLPVELTRLPFIESCFDVEAYSKVGAAGIWQFMPATGRRFMRVDDLVDERRDPITSTRAAAGYLSYLYGALGTWPLAITAYNHGPQGIARAIDAVGTTDIARIVRQYQGNAFGFASRNFYPEFLAALEIEHNHTRHFGDVSYERPLEVREHRLDRPVSITTAARLAGVDDTEIASLNPALSSPIVSGRRSIPSGYRLRLPARASGDFATRLAGLPEESRVVRASARSQVRKAGAGTAYLTHRVQKGQTLSHIAQKHGVSVASLRTANRMRRNAVLRAGQTIKVPVRANEA